MIEITFISHSTSVDNEAGVASGHRDVPLSALGEQQARETGARYASQHFDAVFSSDLQRAYRSVEIAFGDWRSVERNPGLESRGMIIVRDPRLREVDYGSLTGMANEHLASIRGQHVETPFPGGESYQHAVERMRGFLRDLLAARDGQSILICGHAATYYALEHLINGRELSELVASEREWQPGWSYRLAAETINDP